ncbi:MAG: AAA family ATPase [Planctomycetota bacterium]
MPTAGARLITGPLNLRYKWVSNGTTLDSDSCPAIERSMPQSLSLSLPLIVTSRGQINTVQPLGCPSMIVASASEATARRVVRRQLIKACRDATGSELIQQFVRGRPEQGSVTVELAPVRRQLEWRRPIELSLPTFRWRQGPELVVSYVPALDLTVVASPQTDVPRLVSEQIRSALRRHDYWSLRALALLDGNVESRLQPDQLMVQVPTPAELARRNEKASEEKNPVLRRVATRLRRNDLTPAFYREREVGLLGELLHGADAKSVLLVGPSGVGKTAIFHQWFRQLPRETSIAAWATDGSRLISGQTGFGMWQQQCLQMADEASRYPTVLHLGNLVELTESGRLSGSGGCASLLAPRIASGSIVVVIECTAEQLTRVRRQEPRIIAAITPLVIDEPTAEQTRNILLESAASWKPVDVTAEMRRRQKRKRRRETDRAVDSGVRPKDSARTRANLASEHQGRSTDPMVIEPEALEILDRLQRRFPTDSASPGRALSFFRTLTGQARLSGAAVIEAFGRQTGLPRFLIDEGVRPDLDEIARELSARVLGQPLVIEALVDVIATMAADLSRSDRPLASLMLIGPTGVGKTETAKALARLVYSDASRLVRIDMSELSTPLAAGRLIGDAVHPEGVLTSAVRAQPFSLVLLDEFEKAHRSVFDLLLQVLGEGRLTDGRGRTADFRNSIIMMTSNLGVDSFRDVTTGLVETQREDRVRRHFEKQLRSFLRPEMFNRIDQVLSYDPLDRDSVRKIAEKQISDLSARDGWISYGRELVVAEPVVDLVCRDGYQPQFGARPLARQIEQRIVTPMARKLCQTRHAVRHDVDVRLAGSAGTSAVARMVTPSPKSKSRRDVTRVIEDTVVLRRRCQGFDSSDAVRRIRNEQTRITRQLKVELRRAKDREAKAKIKASPMAVHRLGLRKLLQDVDRARDAVDRLECDLLTRFYSAEPIHVVDSERELSTAREQVWDILCQLLSQTLIDRQQIVLVISGKQLSIARRLIAAYARIAVDQQWSLMVHALRPRIKGRSLIEDEVLDAEGWGRKPAFRVTSRAQDRPRPDPEDQATSRFLEVLGQGFPFDGPTAFPPSPSDTAQEEAWADKGNAGADKVVQSAPNLIAYPLEDFDRLYPLPRGTLAVMLSLKGNAVEFMLRGEAGIHTFSTTEGGKRDEQTLLVDCHIGRAIQYVAPARLANRKFDAAGVPRRHYNLIEKMVTDLADDREVRVKMDREGKWLLPLVKDEAERRIWSELDS